VILDKEMQEYIDMKIDVALEGIRKDIKELKSSKVSKDNAVTKDDISVLLSKVKGRY
jgi:hypothetical protein